MLGQARFPSHSLDWRLPSPNMLFPFSPQDVVDVGYLNGLFVLARSIGLIGKAGWLAAGLPQGMALEERTCRTCSIT